jgi:hypothetical protein
MTVPTGLPVGATGVADRATGYELKPNSDGSLNAKTTPASGTNQRVNAQSGDFVAGAITDLATLLALAGTSSDANTVASLMGRLTKIRDLLDATLTVSGTVTANAGTNLNTSALALETGGNLATLAGIVAASHAAVNLAQLSGSAISNTNPVPTQDIEQSGYVALTTPPAQTNAGIDTTLTFSSQVNRVILQNKTSASVYFAFGATASLGSLELAADALLVYPKKCTELHLYTAAAQNINGSADGNIVVLGAM